MKTIRNGRITVDLSPEAERFLEDKNGNVYIRLFMDRGLICFDFDAPGYQSRTFATPGAKTDHSIAVVTNPDLSETISEPISEPRTLGRESGDTVNSLTGKPLKVKGKKS